MKTATSNSVMHFRHFDSRGKRDAFAISVHQWFSDQTFTVSLMNCDNMNQVTLSAETETDLHTKIVELLLFAGMTKSETSGVQEWLDKEVESVA